MLDRVDNAWLAYVIGDLWERERQLTKAQTKFTEAESLLGIAWDEDRKQDQHIVQLIPETTYYNDSQAYEEI